jgi:hypothetical protein
MVHDYENQIITLCARERKFWLITLCQNYFFLEPANHKNYQNIYDYYLLSPDNKIYSHPRHYPAKEENPTRIFEKIAIIKNYHYQLRQ